MMSRTPAATRRLTVLARALPLLAKVSLRLRRRGFDYTFRWIDWRHPLLLGGSPPDIHAVDEMAWAVALAARLLPGRPACLARSLTLRALLNRCGTASLLRFGARADGCGLSAHCWLEIDGRVANDAPDVADRFAPLIAAVRERPSESTALQENADNRRGFLPPG
jgi:hypothetical protein